MGKLEFAPIDAMGVNVERKYSFGQAASAVFGTDPTSTSSSEVRLEAGSEIYSRLKPTNQLNPFQTQPSYAFSNDGGDDIAIPADLMGRWITSGMGSSIMDPEIYGEISGLFESNGGAALKSYEEYLAGNDAILARRKIAYDERNRILQNTDHPFAAQLVGGIGAGFTDPVNLATMPVGAAARLGIIATMAVEATINGALEGAMTPARNRYLEAIGQEDESILMNILVGAGFGATVGGMVKAVPMGARAVEAQIPGGDGRALAREMNRALADNPNLYAQIGSVLQTPQTRRAFVTSLTKSDDPEIASMAQAAMRDLEDTEAAVSNPEPAALKEDETRAQEAFTAANDGVEPTIPDRPITAVPRGSILNGVIEEVRAAELEIMPETFQFKSDADSTGVTEKLRKVEEWDTSLAGIAVVYEFADGTRAIVDGHQRTSLARRIMERDPAQDIKMAAVVFREADGYSTLYARERAAIKNISEAADGMTLKMARDAAKVLRINPDALRNLPAGKGIARAQQLGRLSDDAFSLVINDVVPDNIASLVGKLVEDPNLHMAMMRLMERTKPATTAQAEAILRQALSAPITREVTEDLFGAQEITESLFVERAKVLERAMRILREDDRTFKVLIERQQAIEGAGANKLDAQTNADMKKMIEQALYAVDKLAYRAGPISEALDDGAKTYKGNGRLGDSASRVVSAIRDELERNGLGGANAGDAGRAAKPQGAGREAPDPNEGFADPINGEGPREQIANTRIEVTPEELAAAADRAESIDNDAITSALADSRLHRGVSIGKTQKLWRGENPDTEIGGMSVYGEGFYFTADKKYAANFGDVSEVSRTQLPDNPFRFDNQNDFQIWLQQAAKGFGLKAERDIRADFGDISFFIRTLDAGADGIQVSKGRDAVFVTFDIDADIPARKGNAVAAKTEETPAGSQMLIDGVRPISARERVQAAADRPLLAPTRRSDSEVGGLFDANDPERSMDDMFNQVPAGVVEIDGEKQSVTVSRADLAKELDDDDEFADQLGVCFK